MTRSIQCMNSDKICPPFMRHGDVSQTVRECCALRVEGCQWMPDGNHLIRVVHKTVDESFEAEINNRK